jgi:hypothetical protein
MYEEEKLNRTGVEPVTVKFAIYYTTGALALRKNVVQIATNYTTNCSGMAS